MKAQIQCNHTWFKAQIQATLDVHSHPNVCLFASGVTRSKSSGTQITMLGQMTPRCRLLHRGELVDVPVLVAHVRKVGTAAATTTRQPQSELYIRVRPRAHNLLCRVPVIPEAVTAHCAGETKS